MSRPPLVLGVDAGGTTTRAALVRSDGACLGVGRSGPGNPTSHGPEVALASVREATRRALAQADQDIADLGSVVVAMAGEQSLVCRALVSDFAPAGEFSVVGDVLAMFVSATAQPDGGVVIAGTGSVAARVTGRMCTRVAGGSGWLLGDAGSGFEAGRAVARAAVADLDGIGPSTRLTALFLAELGLSITPGNHEALEVLVERFARSSPVELARFAPLAVEAASPAIGDPVARAIVGEARGAIAALIRALDLAPESPLVVGGGFLVQGLLAEGELSDDAWDDRLAAELAARPVLSSREGVIGAAALALEHCGITVGSDEHQRLRASVAALTR